MNNTASQAALRRLLLVLVITIGIIIYAYGWHVTDISLEETQDQIRQDSVQRAMRELLSPDIFAQDHETEATITLLQVGDCDEMQPIEQPPHDESQPYTVFSAACGEPEAPLTVEGFNFHPNALGQIRLIRASGQKQPFKLAVDADEGEDSEVEASEKTIFDIDGSGHFEVVVITPKAGGRGNVHEIEILGSWPVGAPYLSETTHTVIEKIIETIFLALMATTLAVPISVALSFLAARNLMKQVHIPLGAILVGVIFLPVGWLLGQGILAPVGALGVAWGKALWPGVLGAAAAIGAYVVLARFIRATWREGFAQLLADIVRRLLLVALLLFIVGIIGGAGVWARDVFTEGILQYPGNMVGTIGTLFELLMPFAAALAGALLAASIAMQLFTEPLRRLTGLPGYLAGALLGLPGGALLMVLVALISGYLALLSLLVPLATALMGGQIAASVYNRFTRRTDFRETTLAQMLYWVVYALGAALVFMFTYAYLDLNRAVVDGRPPLNLTWELAGLSIPVYIGKAALIGAVLGAAGGGMAGTATAFPLGMVIYNATRTLLNAVRSIEPLIMGIVFVIWVGVGPFAGVLALTLHSVAALGKLYSEQIESIDSGPIEAVTATGANRLQTIIYAVVPQIVPPYIAFTMYRWDINVRMSTIIGFVGGGGIGFLLQQQINLLRYRDAGVAVLAIAIVVSVLDYTSATIRERMV